MRYDIVLVGYRLNANLKPAKALETVLGLDPETAKVLTRQFPSVVLTGLSQSRAERVAEQLTEVGAKVEVRESRLSHASAPEGDDRSFPADEKSGNYAIGEILAPMAVAKAGSVPPPAQARKASREELDAALRDSLHPPATSRASQPLEVGGEHDAAFAGLQNFGDELDGFGKESPVLEVDAEALRSIQRAPEPAAAKSRRRRTLWMRIQDWFGDLASSTLEWTLGVFWLLLISAVTLMAVGYALDPHDALGALQLQTWPERARQAFGAL